MVVAGGAGQLGLGRRRQPLPRLQLAAGQHQHRPPAPEGRRGDPGAGGQAVHGRAAARERPAQRGRPADHRARPGGHAQPRLLHQRRRRGDRERRPDGPAAHRPAQGAGPLPQLPRQHPDRDPPDRRPAPLGQRLRGRGRRALLRALSVPLGVPRDDAGGGVRAGARAPDPARELRRAADDCGDRARDDPGHGGHHDPAAGLPRRRPRAVRPARHHADLGRGHGRVRPGRRVVRDRRPRARRRLARRARPGHLRQGRQLGLRAAGRRDPVRRDLRDVPRADLPGRHDLLRPPAGLRVRGRDPQRDDRRGHGRPTPARSASDVIGARRWRRSPPSTRSSARSAAPASSGASSWSATRPPGSP